LACSETQQVFAGWQTNETRSISADTRNWSRKLIAPLFTPADNKKTAQATSLNLEVKLDDSGKVEAMHARLAMLLGLPE
jgi:hypothetical protein